MRDKKVFRIFVLSLLLLEFFILLAHDQQIRYIDNQTNRITLSRDAFVQIDVNLDISTDHPVVFKGSGTLVGKFNGRNYVLTANHLCNPHLPPFLANGVQGKMLFVTDFSGEVYIANIVFNSLPDDLCIVEFEGVVNAEPTRVASMPVFINEKIYAFAAPTGFFSPHVIPLFEGHYAGDVIEEGTVSSVYTLPAVGGSSGASVLNRNGEIVGVIHSSLVDFHHIALASTHENIILLFEEYAALSGITILVP